MARTYYGLKDQHVDHKGNLLMNGLKIFSHNYLEVNMAKNEVNLSIEAQIKI